jgi:pyruvate,water dikinase
MGESQLTFIIDLAATSVGLGELGGKGASLARLAAAGFPVPDGFVVSTACYRRFVDDHGLERMLANGDSAEIAAAFAEHPVPDEIAAEIIGAYRELGSPPVAVRSSATAEDLADASFAGQQDSFLNISGDVAVVDAVRRCWASLWNERAIIYRARQRIDPADVAIAVVVQQLVDAEASGVMFTADPITGDDSRIEINAVLGLGEALVNGQASADSFTIARRTGRVITSVISEKMIMTTRTATGTADIPVPGSRRHEPALDEAHASRLAALGVRIAELYESPMDIEWCRSRDELFVVQARPITTSVRRDPWNDSRSGDFLWTNTNVGEAIPDVMTPATWSMVQVFFTDAMATASIPPYVGYGRIGGRIYLNVSVMMTLSGVVGVNENRFRTLTEEVFGRLPDDLEIPPVRAHRFAVLRAITPMALHVLGEARRDVKQLAAYLADHAVLCDRRRSEIAAVATGPELADLWEEVISPEFHHASWMLSAATRSSGASFVTTRKRLQRLVGDAAANALTAGLGSQAGQLASLGLLDGLELLASGEIDRDTFNRRYGHRGPHEFEISTPRPGEDPLWIDRQLAERERSGIDHRQLLAGQEDKRDAAWAAIERRHPLQAWTLHHQLARWAKISRDREQARSEVIRYFWVLRAYALRASQLTGLGEDIFFLDKHEIVRALNGETISATVIADRRSAYRAYCTLPSYPALIRGRFDPFEWARDPRRRSDLFIEGQVGEAQASVQGFPGSAGIVEGRVRVLLDADQGAELETGEVLVTTVTNVGWTPLFPRAAAVITDVGAPLSHAAIVARELGIPAVVGCGNATMLLKTGNRVRVDGTAGTVELL